MLMDTTMVKEENQSSNGKEGNQSSIGGKEELEPTSSIGLSKVSVIQEEGSSSNNDDDELLKTPTGPEHKIPPPLQCPGAPPRAKIPIFEEIPFNPASARHKILKFEFE
jgi:hypothetical protein